MLHTCRYDVRYVDNDTTVVLHRHGVSDTGIVQNLKTQGHGYVYAYFFLIFVNLVMNISIGYYSYVKAFNFVRLIYQTLAFA